MLMMMCPRCRKSTINDSWAIPKCPPCTYQWKTWVDYYRDLGKVSSTITYEAVPEPEPEPNYVESGDFARDVENLVETAVEKAIVLERMNIFDRLEYEVRQITLAGGELPLSRIYNMITDCLADAKEEWERVNGDH